MNIPPGSNSQTTAVSDDVSAHELMLRLLRPNRGPSGQEKVGEDGSTPGSQLKPPAKPEFDLLRHIRIALRGRYAWVLGLGVITGILGGIAGFRMGHPIYSSSGLVRIAYELPKVLTETDQNGPMLMFDTFMQSQRQLITSRHVLDVALQDPIWHTTGSKIPPEPDAYFRRHLEVTTSPRSEYVQIAVSDTDPVMAAAATNSVIHAYAQIYERQERQLEDARMGALNEKSGPLEDKIRELTDEINEVSAEFGTSDLKAFYDASVQRTAKTNAALENIRTAMALASVTPSGASAGTAPPPEEIEIRQIASVDQVMHEYLIEEERCADALTRLRKHYGKNSQPITLAQEALDGATNRVNQYAEWYRDFHAVTAQNLGDPQGAPVLTAGRSLESLRDSESRLNKVLQQEKADMLRIGNKRMELDRLQHSLAATQEDLNQILHRTDTLRAEDAMGGRLSITSTGEIPLGPETDPRMKIAAATGLAGAALPAIALILATFVIPRKYRFADEAERNIAGGFPLLGALPVLDESKTRDVEAMYSAAHSIHQIRVTLRAQAPRDRTSNLYLITSAGAGDGKTSLAMSLGLSFAATRQRTLLIDCDLVGRQLTNALKSQDLPGLVEAIANGSIRKLVRKPSQNLYFLPAGQVGTHEAWSLSAAKLRPLLAQVRRHFDAIIVDTGPILGSVEAAVLAQEVDGVLFIVARDQRRALIERAVHRLLSLNARLEGLIFNRAKSGDFESSLYDSSSRRSRPAHGPTRPEVLPPAAQYLEGFGPVVQAMIATVPEATAPRARAA